MNIYSDVNIGIIVIIALILFYLIMIGIAFATYIMNSIALYSIADRRKIQNPWLAWIPIGNYWTIGSIADDYDARNGMKRKWRVLLLVLILVYVVGFVLSYALMFISIFSFEANNNTSDISLAFSFLIPLYLFIIIIMVCAITLSTFVAICMYKIFESTVPEKAVKYMLLYLLVPIAGPICLLKCRNKGYSNIDTSIPNAESVSEETVSADMVENEE